MTNDTRTFINVLHADGPAAECAGKAVGPDIVQEGTMESGARSRWRFTKIRRDRFTGSARRRQTTAHRGACWSRCSPVACEEGFTSIAW